MRIQDITFDDNVLLDYSKFHYYVVHQFDKKIDDILNEKVSKNKDVLFLMKHGKFVERHFTEIIRYVEGSACCVDKARTIVRELIKHYTNGNNIVFDYDADYIYHLPSMFFTEHKNIIAFYKAIKSLFNGYSDDYITILSNLKIKTND